MTLLSPLTPFSVSIMPPPLAFSASVAPSSASAKTSKAMNEYIDNELYKQFQESHAGRVPARQWIIQNLKALFQDKPFRLLEMGPGPNALSTVDVAKKLPQAKITTVDLDETILDSAQTCLAREGLQNNVDVLQGNIISFKPMALQDGFVACGAFSDLPPEDRRRFFASLPDKLKPGGVFMVEEEVFPALFNGVSSDTQAKAKWRHHGNVIFDAVLKNVPELIKLELQALHSSLHGVGDFKNSLKGMLGELQQAGLKDVSWQKLWPTETDVLPVQSVEQLDLTQVPPPAWQESERAWDALSTNVMRDLLKAKTSQLTDPHFKSAYAHVLRWLERAKAANALYQPNEVPEARRQRISRALGIPLQFGQPVTSGNRGAFPETDLDGGVFVYSAKLPESRSL